ncbi:MAG: T9SS type A sorting domain-containing protein, partial [Ignavibacteriaceae bacterium]
GSRDVLGPSNFIEKTNDGGITWSEQYTSTSSLMSVFFVDSTIGWAVGDNGTILHTTNGGVTFVEEEQIEGVPIEYLLSRNYPNPFNPSTNIKYSLQQTSNVTIKIFDVLGNEIESLINEEKPAGTYELTWEAAGYPSGVYFYQLRATPNGGQAGDFVQTRKMILLK